MCKSWFWIISAIMALCMLEERCIQSISFFSGYRLQFPSDFRAYAVKWHVGRFYDRMNTLHTTYTSSMLIVHLFCSIPFLHSAPFPFLPSPFLSLLSPFIPSSTFSPLSFTTVFSHSSFPLSVFPFPPLFLPISFIFHFLEAAVACCWFAAVSRWCSRLVHNARTELNCPKQVDPVTQRVHWSRASASRLYFVSISCQEAWSVSSQHMYFSVAVHTGVCELRFADWSSVQFMHCEEAFGCSSFNHLLCCIKGN